MPFSTSASSDAGRDTVAALTKIDFGRKGEKRLCTRILIADIGGRPSADNPVSTNYEQDGMGRIHTTFNAKP